MFLNVMDYNIWIMLHHVYFLYFIEIKLYMMSFIRIIHCQRNSPNMIFTIYT